MFYKIEKPARSFPFNIFKQDLVIFNEIEIYSCLDQFDPIILNSNKLYIT